MINHFVIVSIQQLFSDSIDVLVNLFGITIG